MEICAFCWFVYILQDDTWCIQRQTGIMRLLKVMSVLCLVISSKILNLFSSSN